MNYYERKRLELWDCFVNYYAEKYDMSNTSHYGMSHLDDEIIFKREKRNGPGLRTITHEERFFP